jgi:hypothetical protein
MAHRFSREYDDLMAGGANPIRLSTTETPYPPQRDFEYQNGLGNQMVGGKIWHKLLIGMHLQVEFLALAARNVPGQTLITIMSGVWSGGANARRSFHRSFVELPVFHAGISIYENDHQVFPQSVSQKLSAVSAEPDRPFGARERCDAAGERPIAGRQHPRRHL